VVKRRHIYVPLEAGYPFDRVRTWVKVVGQRARGTYPGSDSQLAWSDASGACVDIDYGKQSGRKYSSPLPLVQFRSPTSIHTPLTWEIDAGTTPRDRLPSGTRAASSDAVGDPSL